MVRSACSLTTYLTCTAETRRVSRPAFSGNFPMDLAGSAEYAVAEAVRTYETGGVAIISSGGCCCRCRRCCR